MKVKKLLPSGKTSQLILRGFLFLLIFLFCVNIFSESWQDNSVSFTDIESVRPGWQPFAEGIGYLRGKISQPQIEFWALMVDLGSPETLIVVKDGMAGQNGSLSTKVSSFVRDNNLLAGINAVPFDIASSTEGQPIKNLGIIISEGELLSGANPYYDAIVFYENKTAQIRRQSEIESPDGIENAIGGFYSILADGEPSRRTSNNTERHPRSAAGVSANGRYLFILVVDGRRSDSIGATEMETALLLKNLGSSSAINFDGGGSSTLALRYSDGSVRAANSPVHSGIPGRERAVAGCLGVTIR